MAKRGKNEKKDHRNPKRSSLHEHVDPKDMDDDIDIFHKQREIISLDVNYDDGESIEDEEEPVFDDEDINDGDEDQEEGSEDGDDDSDEPRFATELKKQQKYIREKFGTLDDEIHEEENEEDKKEVWGSKKQQYYGGKDYEGDSSDDEALKEEEEEILRMQREKTKNLSMEDFGLDNSDEDESERELTLEDISKAKNKVKCSLIEEVEKMNTFEEVKKDLNALSREEQMDVVYSSAPELVGLLSELNDALEQLETRVNPLLSKVKNGGFILEGGIHYLEVKQLLLLAYCQAITFYLLLKSEGQPVRDHPVIARLVEIKVLLDKTKQLDGSLPSEVEELLKGKCGENKVNVNTDPVHAPASVRKDYTSSHASTKADVQEPEEPSSTNELLTMEPSKDNGNKEIKHKHKTDQVGVQSMEMLKLRATLEEKLKQRGVFSSFTPKTDRAQKHSKSVNGQLEAYDDFNDDAIDGLSNGDTSLLVSSKLTQLVSAKSRKRKVVSGDDDLPKRDDIGERRRKHELRVLAGAGVVSEEDNLRDELGTLETGDASDMEDGDADADAGVSEDDFYREIKQKRDAKIAAKTAMYTRNPTIPSLPETVEGKRHISYQIEKNRGLTRQRRKDLKNPRKKYRTKHDKEKKRRMGQVQEVRKPNRPYDGEQTGINAGISRSIRF
ncbi:protein THALLO-like isoform X1 [Euphorbia lathyris]|uniref:protein THALLO-like isoform X1 n=1 Tax=Euphorbia lathyris TaxID=212925 RepID=UPI0033139D69